MGIYLQSALASLQTHIHSVGSRCRHRPHRSKLPNIRASNSKGAIADFYFRLGVNHFIASIYYSSIAHRPNRTSNPDQRLTTNAIVRACSWMATVNIRVHVSNSGQSKRIVHEICKNFCIATVRFGLFSLLDLSGMVDYIHIGAIGKK